MGSIVSKIETGEYEILDSGSVLLSQKDGNIKFFIGEVIIELCFENEANMEDKNKISIVEINNKHMQIVCKNFFPLGAGTTNPFRIYSTGSVDIYMEFMAFDTGKLPRVMYTFYKKIVE